MTADLRAFLRARLDEDEQTARAATPGPWAAQHRIDGTHRVIGGVYPLPGAETDNRTICRDGGYGSDWPYSVVNATADSEHIARHNPVRVLAEVDAKRRIIARYEQAAASTGLEPGAPETYTARTREWNERIGQAAALAEVLRILALPWREHPDYRPEWAPTT